MMILENCLLPDDPSMRPEPIINHRLAAMQNNRSIADIYVDFSRPKNSSERANGKKGNLNLVMLKCAGCMLQGVKCLPRQIYYTPNHKIFFPAILPTQPPEVDDPPPFEG